MIQAAYLTVIGMGTAFGLLLVLISSIVITKVIANRLDRAPDPKEKEEDIRQATAAAVAVSILKAKAPR